jgi:hypothetical protein
MAIRIISASSISTFRIAMRVQSITKEDIAIVLPLCGIIYDAMFNSQRKLCLQSCIAHASADCGNMKRIERASFSYRVAIAPLIFK